MGQTERAPQWRRDASAYPYTFRLQTRRQDEDTNGHVNNIPICGYFDEARAGILRRTRELAGIAEAERDRTVTAEARVIYLGEVFHPGFVDIATGFLRLGRSSIVIGQAMFQAGACVGLCEAALIQMAREGGPMPIRPDLRTVMEGFMVRGPEG